MVELLFFLILIAGIFALIAFSAGPSRFQESELKVTLNIELSDLMAEEVTISAPEYEYYVKGGLKKIRIYLKCKTLNKDKTVVAKYPSELKQKIVDQIEAWEKRLVSDREKEVAKREKEKLKRQKEEEKIRNKAAKEKEKKAKEAARKEELKRKEYEKSAKQTLTKDTIEFFKMGNQRTLEANYQYYPNIVELKKIVRTPTEPKSLSVRSLDRFIYSGKIDSVLGANGLREFKERTKGIVEIYESDKQKDVEKFFKALIDSILASGIYLPDKKSGDSLSTYRYLSKFNNIEDVKEFKKIKALVKKSYKGTITEEKLGEDKVWALERNIFREAKTMKEKLQALKDKDLKELSKISGVEGKFVRDERIDTLSQTYSVLKEGRKEQLFVLTNEKLLNNDDLNEVEQLVKEVNEVLQVELKTHLDESKRYKLIG